MKKQNKNELDVDIIGGLEPLTKEEEKAISDFIRADKEKRKLKEIRKKRAAKQKSEQST